MALPTSGPISIGAIAGEFGGSQPDSISEYYRGGGLVPDTSPNSNIPTSGQVSLSNYYGGQAGGGAWSLYSGNGVSAHSLAFDSSGNIYFGGGGDGSSRGFGFLNVAKANTTGTISWQKSIVNSPEIGAVNVYGIDIDSSNNVYVAGNTVSGGTLRPFLNKFDSSGNLVWQKTVSGELAVYDVKIDSSGAVYASVGRQNNGVINLVKFDSSGAVTWQRRISSGTSGTSIGKVGLDSAGNVYMTGSVGTTSPFGVIAKYSSSGVIQWQRRITNALLNAVAADSSDNLYAVGGLGYNAPRKPLIVKYNSSGALQWQKVLWNSTTVSFELMSDVYVKGSYVYAVAGAGRPGVSGAAAACILIAKYDFSGNLQWQKYLYAPTGVNAGRNIKVDNSDNVLVVGQKSGGSVVAILPSLGAAESGTALGVTLGLGSHTDEASSAAEGASSYTAATATLSISNASNTIANSDVTFNFANAT